MKRRESDKLTQNELAQQENQQDKSVLDPHEAKKRRREKILIFVIFAVFVTATYFEIRLSSLSKSLPFVNSIFFFGLINLNMVLLMILVLLVFRNISKIFLERRRQVLGSRLKTKLVLAFLSFTVVPTIILFLISSLYINSSFDKWFSIKVQNTLQAALDITQTYYKNTSRVAQHLAEQVAHDLAEKQGISILKNNKALRNYLKKNLEAPAVDGIEIYLDPLEERIVDTSLENNENIIPRLPLDILTKVFSGTPTSLVQHLGGADLIRAVTSIKDKNSSKIAAVVGVTFVIPISLVNRIDDISWVIQDYKDVNPLKYPVKSTYFIILIMMTLLIIFVSIWIGLYLARELTVPLERLVTATQKISQGNLDFEVINPGSDEIATLTSSFNTMTSQIKKQRAELELKNEELSDKREYVEAVLNNIVAGVVSVDAAGLITTINPTAEKFLNIPSTNVNKNVKEVFENSSAPILYLYNQLLKTTDEKMVQKQFSTGEGDDYKTMVATGSRFGTGYVFVIDDTSYLIKAQREAAWREVARRIAHEIKNPLTPIKLSAQRLQKKFASQNTSEASIFRECTDTIIKNVDELRDMVNEFSAFARFPTANPTPNNLNDALRETVVLYEEAHRSIAFMFEPEQRLPLIEIDRDQIKRVMINLLDNAVSALANGVGNKASMPKKIHIRTFYNEQLKIAVIEIEDNGPGVPENIRNHMFEPYFSTKQDGTGLGLAIVKRIISDHHGFIRVQSLIDEGTKFIIELPANLMQNEVLPSESTEDEDKKESEEKDKWQGLFS